jgi:hypothetical protein
MSLPACACDRVACSCLRLTIVFLSLFRTFESPRNESKDEYQIRIHSNSRSHRPCDKTSAGSGAGNRGTSREAETQSYSKSAVQSGRDPASVSAFALKKATTSSSGVARRLLRPIVAELFSVIEIAFRLRLFALFTVAESPVVTKCKPDRLVERVDREGILSAMIIG